MQAFSTPILFVVFNRPDTTQKVFDKIKSIRPAKLYVGADGPRVGNANDKTNCTATRNIIKQVDWPCEVKTLFNENNLGCGKAVSRAITWFFENEEEGIILEDDCLPNDDFFTFCQALLEKYKDDERIMHIGGTNFQEGNKRGDASYYFSANVHVWGWASWRKAWKKYNFDVPALNAFIKEQKVGYYYSEPEIQEYWNNIFKRMEKHEIDTWDYQWLYTVMNNKGLSVIPQQNLISNIGFYNNATHSMGADKWANMETRSIGAILHPAVIEQNKEADLYTYNHHYKPEPGKQKTIMERIISKIKSATK